MIEAMMGSLSPRPQIPLTPCTSTDKVFADPQPMSRLISRRLLSREKELIFRVSHPESVGLRESNSSSWLRLNLAATTYTRILRERLDIPLPSAE